MDLKLGLEYRDVALRPEHVLASEMQEAEILGMIEALESFAEPVQVAEKTRPLSIDPNDDMILDLAIHGHADVVVTGNTKHFSATGSSSGLLCSPLPSSLYT